ncbi:MAG: aldo/keto reductase [Proteobacteria bacterium]|nr:aldo/keto reductase [Pseudomonadota bacterium]
MVQPHKNFVRQELQECLNASYLKDLQDDSFPRLLRYAHEQGLLPVLLREAGVPLVANQPQYSLIDCRPEASLIPYCTQHGISQLCYGTLAGGFFSSEWIGKPEPKGPFSNRSLTKYKLIIEDFGGWDLFQQLLRGLDVIAKRHGVTVPVVAMRWTLDRPGVAATIVGATSTRHIEENLSVFRFSLTSDDNLLLSNILENRSGPSGDCYDLERDKTGRHGQIMRYNQNQ